MALALGLLLVADVLPAWSAELDPVRALPPEVIGVVGSGPELVLQLRDGDAVRALRPGDIWREGWRLTALSATEATLEKDGARRRIGLGPTGALATQTGAGETPSEVQVVGSGLDPALARRAVAEGRWDGRPMPGLSQEDSTRMAAYETMVADYRSSQGMAPGAPLRLSDALADQIFGQGGIQAYVELSVRRLAAQGGSPLIPAPAPF